jgi:hypothetical protein
VRLRAVAALAAILAVAAGLGAAARPGAASTADQGGRQSRSSGVAIAGGDIYLWSVHRSVRDGGGCTLAFAVQSRATQRVGALTAGHCVGTLGGGPLYTVHQTRNGTGNTTDPGDELGRVGRPDYRLGPNGDSAFVRLIAGRQAKPATFVGGASSHSTIPVVGIARLRDGIDVCYSGGTSGEHCGFRVIGRPETITFPDGRRKLRIHHEWRATRRICTSRAGDSGSPVYVKRRGKAYAVGILSGGEDHAGRCPFFFTPVVLALSRLHLQLVTAAR